MNTSNKLYKLETSLKRKEVEAVQAKKKGMHTTYGNRMMEILEIKKQISKINMGSR